MRIQITAGGIFNGKGEEIPVGTELTVEKEPTGWAGRYSVLSATAGKTPASGKEKAPADPARAELEKLGVDELKKLADDEKIDVKGANVPGDMIAHILKARADRKAAA